MKNIKILMIITIIMLIVSPVDAADSTPSADIQIKLEALKKEIASKAAKLKQEVNRKLTNKTYAGKVKVTSLSSLTIATRSGPKIVSLNQDTVYESNIKSKKKFSQKNIAEEDYLAALGDVDETGVLTAKKIILLNPIPYTLKPKTYLWGQIISSSDKLVALKDQDSKNVAISFTSGSNAKVNDFVIITGRKGKNDIFAAEFVYLIPKGGIIKPIKK